VNATHRIVNILVWGLGIAVAYPFIPMSDSDAFKGLSVMFGFMLTLGSAGIVNQLMSGLVLVYSRALSVGDFVDLGETVGVVSEVGALSTKIINMRNEEVTIPNAVLVGSPIKNYSRLAGARGTLVSTKVTIGYDTPWRQVHAMLIAAAEQTPGLRSLPRPFVYQRGLADWYVEYELFAHMDKPLERVPVLSALHANIQDQFNTYGVQIMSPHFVIQPATTSSFLPSTGMRAGCARGPQQRLPDRRSNSAATGRPRPSPGRSSPQSSPVRQALSLPGRTSLPFPENSSMISFAITVFLSAFLLFQIQPIIAKMILPWFGGSSRCGVPASSFSRPNSCSAICTFTCCTNGSRRADRIWCIARCCCSVWRPCR
jgi:hypothetical protein